MSLPDWSKLVPEVERLLKRLNVIQWRIHTLDTALNKAVDEKVELLTKLRSLGIKHGGDLKSYRLLTEDLRKRR